MKELYQYRITESSAEGVKAEIMIDRDSPVYRGHFPSNPVTPGVFQVQIITDVLQDHLGMRLILSSARSIKFTSQHIPGDQEILLVDIGISPGKENRIGINATLSSAGKTYLKFRGEFSRIQ